MVISTLPATLEKGTNFYSSVSLIRDGIFIQSQRDLFNFFNF